MLHGEERRVLGRHPHHTEILLGLEHPLRIVRELGAATTSTNCALIAPAVAPSTRG
jgi:hypothetical protein